MTRDFEKEVLIPLILGGTCLTFGTKQVYDAAGIRYDVNNTYQATVQLEEDTERSKRRYEAILENNPSEEEKDKATRARAMAEDKENLLKALKKVEERKIEGANSSMLEGLAYIGLGALLCSVPLSRSRRRTSTQRNL